MSVFNSVYGETVPPPANPIIIRDNSTINISSLKWPSIATGSYITTDSTGTSIWNTGTLTSTTDTIWVDSIQPPSPLKVAGDAEFDGDLKIKGKSLISTLEKIEEKLAILHPNIELEEKWENLRAIRKMYMDLEQEIIEKEKVYSILKE